MSTLTENSSPADATTRHDVVDADGVGPKSNLASWRWMVCACLLLGISGGVRFYRDHQFARLNSDFKECPFPLENFNTSLGSWRAIENSDTKLDPEIARVAGSSSHILRTYADARSGEKLHVMVLYGLAEEVFGHTPEVCYPASGYQPRSAPRDKDIPVPPIPGLSQPVSMRSQIFYHPSGLGAGQYTEASYSFRLGDSHEGMWQPDMASRWKSFRYLPGMFKIQMSRDVSAGAANPDAPKSVTNESLMVEMVKEIEHQLALSRPAVK
jgi:hypothetical protein